MNKQLSNKLYNLNLIATIFIVFLHSGCMKYVANPEQLINFVDKIIEFTFNTVPFFFMLSSFLFFHKYDLNKTIIIFKKRVRTLFIPYLFWSIFFLIFVIILTNIPFVKQLNTIMEPIKYDFFSILRYIFWNSFNGVFWYLRDLMIFIIISPLIYILVKKIKKVNFLIILLNIALNIVFEISYYSPFFWLPIYYVTAYLTINKKMESILCPKNKWQILLVSIIFISLLVTNSYYEGKIYSIDIILRYFYPAFFMILFSKISLLGNSVSKLNRLSFYTFCVHGWITICVKRILLLFFPVNSLVCFYIRILVFLISLIIVYISYKIFDKFLPKLLCIITGSRNIKEYDC